MAKKKTNKTNTMVVDYVESNGTLYHVYLPEGLAESDYDHAQLFNGKFGDMEDVIVYDRNGKQYKSSAIIEMVNAKESSVGNISVYTNDSGKTMYVDYINNKSTSVYNFAYTTKTGAVIVDNARGSFDVLNLSTLEVQNVGIKTIREISHGKENIVVAQKEDGKFVFVTVAQDGSVKLNEKATINGVEYGPIDYCDGNDKVMYFKQEGKYYILPQNPIATAGKGLQIAFDSVETKDNELVFANEKGKVIVKENGQVVAKVKQELKRSKKLQTQLEKQAERKAIKNSVVLHSDLDSKVTGRIKPTIHVEPKTAEVELILNEGNFTFASDRAYKEYAKFEAITAVNFEDMPYIVQLVKNIDDRLLVDAEFVKAVKVWVNNYLMEAAKILRAKKDKTHLMKRTPLRRALNSIDDRVEKALIAQELKNGELKTKRQLVGEKLDEFINRTAKSVSKRFEESKQKRAENKAAKAKRKNERIEEKNKKLASELETIAKEIE